MTEQKYNPVDYWLAETKNIPGLENDIQNSKAHHSHLKNISLLLEPFMDEIKTVFEIACGYGRITKHMLESFPNIECYHAMDLSPFKIEEAIKYIPADKYKDVLKLTAYDFAAWFPVKSEYDLVLASEVLMHQLPDEIEHWISKMNCLSQHYIMNIDYYETNPTHALASHNFNYDYGLLYKQIITPCDVVTRKIESVPQRIYLVIK